MNANLPPLICPECEKPIWVGDPMTLVTGSDEEGNVVAGPIPYHQGCAPEPGEPPS